jgi:hypothetical protein
LIFGRSVSRIGRACPSVRHESDVATTQAVSCTVSIVHTTHEMWETTEQKVIRGMRFFRILMPAIIGLALLPMISASPAYAHERRAVGKYDFVVGFVNEPAFQDEPNGLDLAITDRDSQQPVEGLEKTLKVTLAFGGNPPKELPLRARFRMPGKYTADLIPTRSGTYTWTVTGDILGQAVGEKFESGPGRFNDVESAANLHFPVRELSSGEVSTQLADAQRTAAQAQLLGLIGVGAGVLGLVVGGMALLATRRRQPSVDTAPTAHPVV